MTQSRPGLGSPTCERPSSGEPSTDGWKPLGEQIPIPGRGEHLGHLVRSWRGRLRPEAILSTTASGRRKRSASQEDVARLIGASSHWYARLERGDTDIYSADFLDRTAVALGLSSAERDLLYLYAVSHEPVQVDAPPQVSVAPPLQQFVQEQKHPVFICDDAWHLLDHNSAMNAWFPWIATEAEPNFVRWALFAPEARLALHGWDTQWVPLLLAHLMETHARYPGDTRLGTLIREVLGGSDLARRIWSRGPQPPADPPGGHHRLRVSADQGTADFDLIMLRPPATRHINVMSLVPA
jgi:transcriptional regulator with XRE-family HTH domain